jgi:hypothetical protein
MAAVAARARGSGANTVEDRKIPNQIKGTNATVDQSVANGSSPRKGRVHLIAHGFSRGNDMTETEPWKGDTSAAWQTESDAQILLVICNLVLLQEHP